MAHEPEKRFDLAENKLLTALKPAFALTNQSEMVALAANYLIETAFRFIKLGSRVKQEIEKNRLALDAAIKAEGIFREPVHVGLDNTMVRNFWFNGRCKLLYPNAYQLMEPERTLFATGTEAEKQKAWKILKVACRVIPDYLDDQKLSDPLLQELVGKWIDPGNKNIREIVLDLAPFLGEETFSLNGLKENLRAHTLEKLAFHQSRLDKLTEAQLQTVNTAINDLVWGALEEDDNSVDKTLEFLVNRRLLHIDEEIDFLNKEREKWSDPDAEPSATATEREARDKESRRMEARIKELEELKAKLKGT